MEGDLVLDKANEQFYGDSHSAKHQISGLEKPHQFLLNENHDFHTKLSKLKEDLKKEKERLQSVLHGRDHQHGLLREDFGGIPRSSQPHLPETQIQEKIVEIVKSCNHLPEIRELQGKIDSLQGDLSLKNDEIEKLKSTNERLQSDQNAKELQVKTLEENIEKLRSEFTRISSENERLQGELRGKDSYITNLKEEMEKSQNNLTIGDQGLRFEIEKLTGDLTAAQGEASRLREMASQKDQEIDVLKAEILKKENEKLEIQAQEKLTETEKDCGHLSKIKELLEVVELLEREKSLNEVEIKNLKEEIESLKNEHSQRLRVEETQRKIEGSNTEMKNKIEELLGIIAILEKDAVVYKGEKVKLNRKIEKLKEKVQKLKGKKKDKTTTFGKTSGIQSESIGTFQEAGGKPTELELEVLRKKLVQAQKKGDNIMADVVFFVLVFVGIAIVLSKII